MQTCGDTPLHIAAVSGAVAAGELLIAAGATVDVVNADNMTPLLWYSPPCGFICCADLYMFAWGVPSLACHHTVR